MRPSRQPSLDDPDADRARRDPGLRVAPVRVGDLHSTTGLLVAAGIMAVVGLALMKPWTASAPATPSPAEHAIAAVPSIRPSTASTVAPRPTRTLPSGVVVGGSADTEAGGRRAIRLGDWATLAGDVDHLAGQPIVSERDLDSGDGDGTCGGSARIAPFDELFAIVAEPGERVAAVRLFAIDPIGRPDIPTRIWTDRAGPLDGRALDRLTVVALPRGGIAPRRYALIAETTSAAGSRQLTYTICIA